MQKVNLKHTAYIALIGAALFCVQAYAGSDTTLAPPLPR
jgi:hypothetical protein